MYRELQAEPILATVATLKDRIHERFPDSSLAAVAGELHDVAHRARRTAGEIARPIWPLRVAIGALIAVMVLGIAVLVPWSQAGTIFSNFPAFIQVLEAGINDIVLIGAGIFFLATLEGRIKRRRALAAMHELRSLAHIIDMHQLTKDPDRILRPGADTASSPKRTLSAFDLSRYLDYCSELLAMIGKLAALYAEKFDDEVALDAVNELEELTNGLSRKIWQKMMMLHPAAGDGHHQ